MLILVKFSSSWCVPCKRLQVIWDKLKKTINDVDFVSFDVDTAADMVKKYDIMSLPTLVFIKDSQVVHKMIGLYSEKDIVSAINKHK